MSCLNLKRQRICFHHLAGTSKAVSGAITISLAGNVTSQWVCNAATRNDTAGTLTLTSLNSNTINVFQNIRALPGNPDTTCPVTPTPSPSPSPTPEPSPSPEPSANTCTYRGIWRISPLYSPCNKVYLSYNAHACEAKSNVTLMTETVQGSTGYSATLGLDHSVKDGKATAAPIVATNVYDDCAADKLDVVGESGAVQPQLSSADFNWKIVPFKRSCFEVNLISDAPATKGKFLAVPNTCKSFAWASKDGGRARFKLTMVSELPSTTTPTPSNGNIIVG